MTAVGEIILSSFTAVMKVYIMMAFGYYLSKRGFLTTAGSRTFVHMIYHITLPCLFFVNMATAVGDNGVGVILSIILMELVHFAVLFFLGYLLVVLTKPPLHFRYALLLGTAFVNCGDMPLAILLTIGTMPPFEKGDLDNGIAYVTIYAMISTILFWTICDILIKIENERYLDENGNPNYLPNGSSAAAAHRHSVDEIEIGRGENLSEIQTDSRLVIHVEDDDDDDEKVEDEHSANGGQQMGAGSAQVPVANGTAGSEKAHANGRVSGEAKDDIIEMEPLDPGDAWKQPPQQQRTDEAATLVASQEDHERSRTRREAIKAKLRIVAKMAFEILFSPPNVGSWLGLFVGFIPPLKDLLISDCEDCEGAPLKFLYDTLYLVGFASIPINIMNMGAAIQKNPFRPLLGYPITLSLTFVKLVAMPAIGFGLVYLCAYVLPWMDSSNKMLLFVLVLESAMPTAQMMISVEQRHRSTGIEMASVMFLQYVLVVLTSPIVITILLYTLSTHSS